MLKKLFLLIVSMVFFAVSSASAKDLLYVRVNCPASVKAGSALWVTVNTHNKTNSMVRIGKTLVSLAGNAHEGLTGISLYGPFSFPSVFKVPPSADGPTQTIKVIDSVPQPLVNKVAIATVVLTTADYKASFGHGICLVDVKK